MTHLHRPVAALVLSLACGGGGVACDGPTPTTATPPAPTTATTTAAAPIVVTDEARAKAQRGEFPTGPEVNLLMGKCAIGHTTQYLTTQRLKPVQREKTLKKMKGWGAPIDDAEAAQLQRSLGAYFTPELAPPRLAVVAPPVGAVP
jgi:hypothetical protein